MEAFHNFTAKAGHYAKYRPTYPQACLDYLANEVGLAGKTVADIGCGTGIFTRQLSPIAQTIHAVEPNADMRQTCQQLSTPFPNILVHEGLAEQTGLPDNCVDFITTAQAFHWFEVEKFRTECQRLLKADGQVVIIWNSIAWDNPIIIAIRQLCAQLGIAYTGFNFNLLKNADSLQRFFANSSFVHRSFANDIVQTREQFIGRYLSSSYSPKENDACYSSFVRGLTDIFEQSKHGELITLPCQTISYVGKV